MLPKHLENKKICVYTVITNNYDSLREHVEQDIPCDYICFTNNKTNMSSQKYKFVEFSPVDKTDLKFTQETLDIMNVCLYRSNLFIIDALSCYDICVYIDGNAAIIKKDFLRNLLIEENLNNFDIIISRHPDRNCIYDEAFISARIPKYQNTDLGRQVMDYFNDRYPQQNGLYWNGFMVLLHPFDDNMREFYDMYTDHLFKYVKNPLIKFHPQGQVSLPYVLHKTNIKYKVIDKLYKFNYDGNVNIRCHNV